MYGRFLVRKHFFGRSCKIAIQSLAGTESIAAVAASIDIRLLWTVCLLDMSAIFLGLKKKTLP